MFSICSDSFMWSRDFLTTATCLNPNFTQLQHFSIVYRRKLSLIVPRGTQSHLSSFLKFARRDPQSLTCVRRGPVCAQCTRRCISPDIQFGATIGTKSFRNGIVSNSKLQLYQRDPNQAQKYSLCYFARHLKVLGGSGCLKCPEWIRDRLFNIRWCLNLGRQKNMILGLIEITEGSWTFKSISSSTELNSWIKDIPMHEIRKYRKEMTIETC